MTREGEQIENVTEQSFASETEEGSAHRYHHHSPQLESIPRSTENAPQLTPPIPEPHA